MTIVEACETLKLSYIPPLTFLFRINFSFDLQIMYFNPFLPLGFVSLDGWRGRRKETIRKMGILKNGEII